MRGSFCGEGARARGFVSGCGCGADAAVRRHSRRLGQCHLFGFLQARRDEVYASMTCAHCHFRPSTLKTNCWSTPNIGGLTRTSLACATSCRSLSGAGRKRMRVPPPVSSVPARICSAAVSIWIFVSQCFREQKNGLPSREGRCRKLSRCPCTRRKQSSAVLSTECVHAHEVLPSVLFNDSATA